MSEISTTTPTGLDLCLSSPADVIESVPYLLGFHPGASLVVVGVRETGLRRALVEVVGRVDRPPGEPLTDDLLDRLFVTVAGSSAQRALVIDYSVPDTDEAQRVELQQLQWAALRAQVELVDVLGVDTGRWRSLLCEDEQCCPTPAGWPRRRRSPAWWPVRTATRCTRSCARTLTGAGCWTGCATPNGTAAPAATTEPPSGASSPRHAASVCCPTRRCATS